MINSKQKGARSEREVARILREHGIESRRTAQYCGNSGDAADVTWEGFHVEVKHRETTAIWSWLDQANSDAKDGDIPIVVFRKNHEKWQVCMDFEEFLELLGHHKLPFRDVENEF